MKEGENISILLLGDEGVGKSSLASTFVSRHFSDQVPGILTRVCLPSDPSQSKCTTTIVDTQEGDTILSNAILFSGASRDILASSTSSEGKPRPSDLAGSGEPSLREDVSGDKRGLSLSSSSSKYESASAILETSPYRGMDAIILVFDLERIETFHRLEEHWLPLIEQCYNGELPVIVAGNKVDLPSASGSQNSPSRQQIISLLQRFKFVRQCIKCSAKKLVNVDEVFRKSQQSVLYPLYPLFDIATGKLTTACSRAFTRIFRIFDTDRDGLLSDAELNIFQQKIWGVSLIDKDFNGWKRMVRDHHRGDDAEDTIVDGKFTVAGFLAIFDVLITGQNRPEVPWKVLRALGYDDELNLNIPESISPQMKHDLDFPYIHPDNWRLTRSDIDFLTSIFVQYDSDGDGILSPADIRSIFSVLLESCPPWEERRKSLFRDCFSCPGCEAEETRPVSPSASFDPVIDSSSPSSHHSSPSSIISASGVTISSSPLPSVDLSKDSDILYLQTLSEYKPLSLLSWINRWHMICTISPTIARTEMYRLGHSFEWNIYGTHQKSRKVGSAYSNVPPLIDVPSTFIRAVVLGGVTSGKRGLVQKIHKWHYSHVVLSDTEHPTTSCSVSKIMRPKSGSSTTRKTEETMVHVILTEVPVDVTSDVEKNSVRNKLDILLGQDCSGKRPYDMAVLVFDAMNKQSLDVAKELEREVLSEDMPRVFIGTTSEAVETRPENARGEYESIGEAYEHCKSMDLEPPLFVSLKEETKLDPSVIEHLLSCADDKKHVVVSFRSTPHGERKRKYASRRKALWIGGLVTAGITVVLGFTFTGKKKILPSVGEKGGWLGFFQKLLPFR